MPELPEVETIVTDLNKKIKDYVIIQFWSNWEKGLKLPLKKFQNKIKNTKVLNTKRTGKHILINLNNNHTIVIHLKMTGHLLLDNNKSNSLLNEKVNGYIHHIFYFKNGNSLKFSDLRKFGWINLVSTSKIHDLPSIKKLGLDALNITFNQFKDALHKAPKTKIGTFLLLQEAISGIGNIYRSEILYEAKINPFMLNTNLNNAQIKKIWNSTKKILTKAIRSRGTSDSDYRDTNGKTGKFQKILKVYRKENKPCQECKTIILRKKLAGRSAFYCPKCQKKSP